jgi:hypothetical protein
LVYEAETYRAVNGFFQAAPGWEEWLKTHPAQVILAPREAPVLERLGATGAWERLYDADGAVILGRRP